MRNWRFRWNSADAAKAAFEAAHRRLFGFAQPELPVLIAGVEVEGEAGGAPAGEATSGPALAMASVGGGQPGVAIAAEAMTGPVNGPVLIVRGDTQIAVARGWRAERQADGLIRLKRLDGLATGGPAAETVDPLTLELFNRRFMGVAEAMGAALERTAQSVNIKERLDFSCALFDAGGGLVANAPHMPVHLGSMGASVRAVTDAPPRTCARATLSRSTIRSPAAPTCPTSPWSCRCS